jgi:hypothetical protein
VSRGPYGLDVIELDGRGGMTLGEFIEVWVKTFYQLLKSPEGF